MFERKQFYISNGKPIESKNEYIKSEISNIFNHNNEVVETTIKNRTKIISLLAGYDQEKEGKDENIL